MRLSQNGLLKVGFLAFGLLIWISAWPGEDSIPAGGAREVTSSLANSGSSSLDSSNNGARPAQIGRRFPGTDRTRPSSGRTSSSSGGRNRERPSRSVENNLARLSRGEFEERAAPASASPPRSRPNRSPQRAPVSQQSPSRRNQLPPGLAARGGMAGELDQLDRGYETAQNLLFSRFRGVAGGGGASVNPFDQALDDNSADTPADPTPSDDGDAPDTGEPPSNDSPDGEVIDGTEGGDPVPPDTAGPAPVFDFLLVGVSGPEDLIVRAVFGGSGFMLEDGSRFDLFLGGGGSLLNFDPDTFIMIEDSNQDGRDDLLLIREIPFEAATGIELFEQSSGGGTFSLVASTVVHVKQVQSAVLFDIEGDGQLELLFGLAGRSRFFVYERVRSKWDYSREYVLPIVPALMIVTREGSIDARKQLQIIGPELQVVLTARSESPEAFSFGFGTPLQRMGSVSVDFYHAGGTLPEIRFIQMADRLLFFDVRDGQPVAFANLDTGSKVPVLLIGDYSRLGKRELIWLP